MNTNSFAKTALAAIFGVGSLLPLSAFADTYQLTYVHWNGTHTVCSYANGSTVLMARPESPNPCAPYIIISGEGAPRR